MEKLQKLAKLNYIDIGRISKWLVAEGVLIKKGQAMLELQTEKAVVLLDSEHDGILYHNKFVGEIVYKDDILASFDEKINRLAPKDSTDFRLSRAARKSENSIEKEFFPYRLVTSKDIGFKKIMAKESENNFLKAKSSNLVTNIDAQINSNSFIYSVNAHPLLKGFLLPVMIQLFYNALFQNNVEVGYISMAVDREDHAIFVNTSPNGVSNLLEEIRLKLKKIKQNQSKLEWLIPSPFFISDLTGFAVTRSVALLGQGQMAGLSVCSEKLEKNAVISLNMVYDHSFWTGTQAAKVLSSVVEQSRQILTPENIDALYG